MDVPYPPDYGGVIDVFYKVKALADLGIKIHLHCFQYGRPQQEQLNAVCEKVYYYKRKTGLNGISLCRPYMQYSRRDKALLANLVAIPAPILLEGVHCTYYLNHKLLKNRKIFIRNQNIEADYFKQLQYRTSNWIAKLYYNIEARLLKKTERQLHRSDGFLTVAQTDFEHFSKLYPKHLHAYIPSFTESIDLSEIVLGSGNNVLYQGNLGHPENHEAAMYILEHIVPAMPNVSFVFAGKMPQQTLTTAAQQYKNVSVIPNPSAAKMHQLIQDAHIHLLLTFQATGLKLKLLAAANKGRHILANDKMLMGSNLEDACIVANTPQSMIAAIKQYLTIPFDAQALEKRRLVMTQHYNQKDNAERLAKLLFEG